MTLKEFHTAVQQRADTCGLKISAADTSRVLSEAFSVMAELGDGWDILELVRLGVKKAKEKAAKAKC